MKALIPLFILTLFSSTFALAQNNEAVWLDVRSNVEFAFGSAYHAVNIPHSDLSERLDELPADKSTPIYVFCRAGVRARKAQTILENAGYSNIENVKSVDNAIALQQSVMSQRKK